MTTAMNAGLVGAYNTTGASWQAGPGRVYDQLGHVVADHCPAPLGGAFVLDLGAGTGAATRAAQFRGATVVAVDVALGMLRADAGRRPPAAVGDALALPFATGVFDAVLAAFSLNHVIDPVTALREAARVLRPGGAMVAAAYAVDDAHPVRVATEAAAATRGWSPPPWHLTLREEAVSRLATVDRAAGAARRAGLNGVEVTNRRVPFPELEAEDLVAWRLGMAHMAPFVNQLPPAEQSALLADAAARLGPDPPMLVRSIILLTYRAEEGVLAPASGAIAPFS